MNREQLLERKLIRESAIRKEAERLLEEKSLELYQLNQKLQVALSQLEKQSKHDLRKLEFEARIDEVLIDFGRAFLNRTLDDGLISSFLHRLTDNSVIMNCYLELDSELLESAVEHRFGDQTLSNKEPKESRFVWDGEILQLSIELEHEQVGYIVFDLLVGDIEKDFIANQMSLVKDLFCSAVSRQLMHSKSRRAQLRAEESEKATKEFVAMINHELRTPLNGLLGSAELLADTELTLEQSSLLGNLTNSGELLRHIINDLLDFSKMNAGMMELVNKPFGRDELTETLTSIFKPKAQEKNIGFTIQMSQQIPEYLVGDFERICQISVNLVGNAIKFTSSGAVRVNIDWRDEAMHIEVIDTGPGIENDLHEALFDPFIQADRTAKRRFEGTGLGLAICKNLALLMQGDIGFFSTVGKGSQFYVSLPLEEAEAPLQSVVSGDEELTSFEALSILVVDDIRMNQIIINQMLKKLEVVPQTANNGIEAIKLVEAVHYDIVFMDCRMPEMDGFEATHHLREQGYQLPIIALTAGTTLEERQRCIECGMNDILTKPYTANDLRMMLAKWSP
ncbi:response regulator [Vibrio sp. TRT 21S02]|uniref:response regulator n=1 Tax=Vibrio sp. TRT 21S02 TaxID=3418507 RepID=UPI003CEB1E30